MENASHTKVCMTCPKSAGHVHVHSLQSMSMSIVCRPCPKFAGHLQSLQVMSMCKACSFSVQFCDLIIPSTVKILGQPLNKSHHPSFCNGKPADPMDCKLLTISCQSKTKKEIFFLIKKMANLEIGDECASEGGEEAKAHGGSVHSSQPPVLLPHQ